MDDPEVLNDLFLQAERGKKTLTQRDKAPFRVTHAGQSARVELDRAKFEEITRHLLDRTIELTREMLADAKAKGLRAVRQDDPRRRRHPDAAGPRPARRRVRQGARSASTPTRPSPRGPRSSASRSRSSSRSSPTSPSAGGEEGAAFDPTAVSEAEMQEALDQIEQETGFTLTGPVRELVSTQIVNVLSQEPRRDRPQRRGPATWSSTSCPATARCRWSGPRTSAPTSRTRRASTSGSWPASATAPSRWTARRSASPS